ncbi:sigma-54 interaction domain-containing protein [Paraburkholderia hospita]|uniref:sigma-54 interaction domain-containing protein n=1 Tax=Paraburkholderia hospita TaxID=169430 RepID=UPI003ECED9AB
MRGDDIVVVAFAGGHLNEAVHWLANAHACIPSGILLAVSDYLDCSQITGVLGAGAFDYVAAHAGEHELRARVRRALGWVPVPAPSASPGPNPRLRNFVGTSPLFAREVAKLPKIATCDSGVLVIGETGTGKEICAQTIHYLSPRWSHPWVAVNCGAIPAELIENELFGHVRGAYTTAQTSRIGLVREAEGGTLFLDDVDTLPLSAQAKLLRFLQEREYRAVGSNTVQRANIRVIAASNRCLAELANCQTFRKDLYFRLNVLNVSLPPLRERREDIPALAMLFVYRFARDFDRRVTALTPDALRSLMNYTWPGNVRELQHVIERAVLMASGPVLAECDIDVCAPDIVAPIDKSFRAAKSRVVANFERNYLEQLLAEYHGNITLAARAAQKNRRALFELIRKHRIEPSRFKGVSI